jgi:hypothetical protein
METKNIEAESIEQVTNATAELVGPTGDAFIGVMIVFTIMVLWAAYRAYKGAKG